MYQHQFIDGRKIDLPLGKVVCVGRNYLEHIQELNNEVPNEPLLFIKPNTALCNLAEPIVIPKGVGSCHNELEIAILIGQRLNHCNEKQAKQSIIGVGLGLDLTLRDVQDRLKAKGQPWERAKSFDASCPISVFVQAQEVDFIFSGKYNKNLHFAAWRYCLNRYAQGGRAIKCGRRH